MNRDEALDILAAHRDAIMAKGVRTLMLVGPILHEDIRPDSEIDMLVEFVRPVGLEYFGLAELLAELLGRSVHLIVAEHLPPQDREELLRDAIRAA